MSAAQVLVTLVRVGIPFTNITGGLFRISLSLSLSLSLSIVGTLAGGRGSTRDGARMGTDPLPTHQHTNIVSGRVPT